MSKVLMKGNEAIGEAAIRAGCSNYFAYPITPQSEVAEYLSRRLPEVNGVFLQGESEVAVSYMIFGAAACGERVFTTSSSPGISLMSEGISYITAAECPAVFVNIMRGGPGLGGILPSQADYFQATKGGGHGDYKLLAEDDEQVYAYVRSLDGKKLLVVNNFSEKDATFVVPEELSMMESELLISNYDVEDGGQSEIRLRPYESHVYKMQ